MFLAFYSEMNNSDVLSWSLFFRLELFHALTANGKDLTYFETETGKFDFYILYKCQKKDRLTKSKLLHYSLYFSLMIM